MDWAVTFFTPANNAISLYMVIDRSLAEVPDSHELEKEKALKILDKAKAFFTSAGFEIIRAEYTLGDPIQAICCYADEIKPDSIIMGSHGRTSLLKLLFGSVSAGVFEKAKYPVLMVKNI